jgi:formylglycine-generating enzyme required for sulfatase activity
MTMSRSRLLAIVAACVLALAAAGAWLWVDGGKRAETLARVEPKQCLDPALDASGPHPGMVWVPAGTFAMGDTVYAEEAPIREAKVDGFWIDRHDVTNDEFAAFVKATGYVTIAERPVDPAKHPELPPEMLKPGAVVFVMPNSVDGSGDISQWWQYIPGANWRHPGGPQTSIEGHGAFPVVAVAYEDALAYARWKGRALPNETQWEWAARGGDPRPTAMHDQPREANTWQGVFPVLNTGEDGFVGLAPVGCFKPNGFGLYDMIGNAWQWTSDFYTARAGATPDPKRRVIKGGSYLCAPNYCLRYRAGSRQGQESDLAASHLGFRTILEAAAP